MPSRPVNTRQNKTNATKALMDSYGWDFLNHSDWWHHQTFIFLLSLKHTWVEKIFYRQRSKTRAHELEKREDGMHFTLDGTFKGHISQSRSLQNKFSYYYALFYIEEFLFIVTNFEKKKSHRPRGQQYPYFLNMTRTYQYAIILLLKLFSRSIFGRNFIQFSWEYTTTNVHSSISYIL